MPRTDNKKDSYQPQEGSYPYLSDKSLNAIRNCASIMRRHTDGQKNLFYIVANYSNAIEKDIFEATKDDVRRYTEYLTKKINNKQLSPKYCGCVFVELGRFFLFAKNSGIIEENPFDGVSNEFPLPQRTMPPYIPTLSEVDRLFSCINDSTVYLAALLSFRMALSISELVGLKKEQFHVQQGKYYLSLERWVDRKKGYYYLVVPDDVVPYLIAELEKTPKKFEFVLANHNGGQFQIRTLQNSFAREQAVANTHITLSNLRSLCIYLMTLSEIPFDKIASYCGVKGGNLPAMNRIPPEIILDAASYVNIKMLPPIGYHAP